MHQILYLIAAYIIHKCEQYLFLELYPWRVGAIMIASVTGAKPTECHAEDENKYVDTPSKLKSSKTTEANISRRPLGDHTNVSKNGRGEKLQSAIATIECSENFEETDSKEDIKLDEQGFVIWADDKVEGEEKTDSDEVRRLRTSLASALEENRLVLFHSFFSQDI